MSTCPECNKEIKLLNYKSADIEKGYFNGEFEALYSDKEISFSCPECDETLFDTEHEAKDFLDGKTAIMKKNKAIELSGDYEKFSNDQLRYILRSTLQVLGFRVGNGEFLRKSASPIWKIQSYIENYLSDNPNPSAPKSLHID